MLSLERARIGIVEDDPIMGESLLQRLSLEGSRPAWWQTGAQAIAAIEETRPDALVCDIRLPDMNGEDLLRRIMPLSGQMPVLFITAYADIDQAVRLIRAGADDYMTKPFAMADFLDRIGRLLARRQDESSGSAILGDSRAMRTVEALLRRVAPIDSAVLLTGESGVGKEVAAHFLHDVSPRAAEPFVAINCAAVPGDLLESEMFGHERGSFTGAHNRHEGYAERAGRGTLFLDEISEMPLPMQAKLLRLVQDHTFFRVGGENAVPFQARLVCATNADLRARIDEGRFRKDLYYRLDVIHIPIPPLRERREDILPLIDHYVTRFALAFDREVRGLTTMAHEAVLSHAWPGNVRELRNRVERAVALAEGPWLSIRNLFPEREGAVREENASPAPGVMSLADARAEAERRCIRAALREADGKANMAAALLGISRSTLFEKMRRLGIAENDSGQ